MKKCIIVIIALFYSFISVNNGFAANAWTQKAGFGGTARTDAVGFSIGSKGYIGTGYDGSLRLKDFWEYDPTADAWTQKADFGIEAQSAVGFSIGNKGYIGSGQAFWEYDPAAVAWTQKTDFGGSTRGSSAGFSINSKGYIGTGSNIYLNPIELKDFWEYDPAAVPAAVAWTQKTHFGGTARTGAVGFSIGSKGYIGTGSDASSSFTKDFWEYDPAADAWTQKTDFGGTARTGAVGFSIGSKGYIGTGSDASSSFTKDFWEYDPDANTWTQKADFVGTARTDAVGFSIGSKGYIGTGEQNGSLTKDFWEYDPANGTIDTTPDQFTFTAQTGVTLSMKVTSNTITVSGINAAAPLAISYGGDYSINGGSYTSASGTVNNGDTITLQLISSDNYSATASVMLSIGGVSGIFNVTSLAQPPDDSSGVKCFIATAAFGSPMERHVQILRDFRDRYLLNYKLGQKFVKLYYQISPPIADTIAKSEVLRMITRWCLMPFIGVAYLTVMFGIIPILLVLTISFLMLFSFVLLPRKKAKKLGMPLTVKK
jgi:hypothetical protein